MAAGLPVPAGHALAVRAVREIATTGFPEDRPLSSLFSDGTLFSIRSSPVSRSWGGPETILNIGMNAEARARLAERVGAKQADALYCRFIRDYAVQVARLDVEDFEAASARLGNGGATPEMVDEFLDTYERQVEDAFPQDPEVQFREGLHSMILAWEGTSARILREARGAPPDAGLGLILQEMVLCRGPGSGGSGYVQYASPISGEDAAWGNFQPHAEGRPGRKPKENGRVLGNGSAASPFGTDGSDVLAATREHADVARRAFGEEMRLDFVLDDGSVWLLDAKPAERSARAAITIAARLVRDGLASREEALLSIDPLSLNEVMLSQVDPRAELDVFATGFAASPGAATGRIVFSAMAAQAMKSREEDCILLRVETSPEDIRGMHSASAILTEKGGMTSHAAVVARGLGVPCVTGAREISVDAKARTVTLPGGRVLNEGDTITVDGTGGRVVSGAPGLVEPELDGFFGEFMRWADEARTMGVRANADTLTEARVAMELGVDGIGLVRTEHMFFEPGRLTVMRELIFAESGAGRQAALNLLLPMQRGDFVELFRVMAGLPVCIRLLDPPLHEFLPRSRQAVQRLAEAMALPVSSLSARIEELSEFNPMLGLRGVRLGITVPEIYDMQARAIFEAAVIVAREAGVAVEPEIMVPLVSENREVEIVKSRVDAVAAAVRVETGFSFEYSLGVMVETPRAVLRAHDISRVAEFLSFGTNDLTQMTYGLSRDDAGRFMRDYVNLGVFREDPFQSLDAEGVGELLLLAIERGRRQRENLLLGLCGEHGGDPESVGFCHSAGFDYVSCSPYRTPVARLAAAQQALRDPDGARRRDGRAG